MGARHITALNLICIPGKKLPLDIMEEILRGGAEKAAKAGISIIDGHSLKDTEPKYDLLGHLHEMTLASGVGAHIRLSKIPVVS